MDDNINEAITKRLVKGLELPRAGTMSIKTTMDQIIISGENINETYTVSDAVEQQGYGFGFFSSHYAHNCDRIGSFSLENCVYTEVNLVPHNLYVDPNGGTWRNSSDISSLEGVCGDTYSIELPVRPNYTFVGWQKIGSSGTMTSLTSEAVYTFGEDEETDDRLIAQWIKIDATKQSDITTGKVAQNQEITYTITATNTGTVDGKAIIKDVAPEGTTFIPNSIIINGVQSSYTEQNLADGITIPVSKPDTGQTSKNSTLSFKVRVNKLNNNTLIKNIAQYQDITVLTTSPEKMTNEVTLQYVEPIISQSKSQLTQNKESFVVKGEKITYTIYISNDGGLGKEVIVKDTIPEGTTFVAESVKINEVSNKNITEDDLKNGIPVAIPEETKNQNVSFDVIVNDLEDEDVISNIAFVDEEQTNEVSLPYKEPIINRKKSAKTQYNKDYVASGEIIRYDIIVTNDGSLEKKVIIKDKIPENTTFIENSIKVNGETFEDENGKVFDKTNMQKGIEVLVPPKKEMEEISTEDEEKTELGENVENTEELTNQEKQITTEEIKSEETTETVNEKKYTPGEIILSFEVLVNELQNDSTSTQIKNVAIVDGKNTNEVTHEVLPFNMKIEEKIKEISIDNINQNIVNDEIMKTEVHTKLINTASVITKYNIQVTNTGKIPGTATIQDTIPQGYKVSNINPSYWKSTNDGKLETTTEIIQPGESKTLEVVLSWQNGPNNFGEKINKAEIVQTDNESNAIETTLQDNSSKTTILLSLRTGEINDNIIITTLAILSFTILITGIITIKKKVLG